VNFVYSTARWLSVGLGEKLHLIFLSLEKRVSGQTNKGRRLFQSGSFAKNGIAGDLRYQIMGY